MENIGQMRLEVWKMEYIFAWKLIDNKFLIFLRVENQFQKRYANEIVQNHIDNYYVLACNADVSTSA